jgi:YjbE family integral membrane protein
MSSARVGSGRWVVIETLGSILGIVLSDLVLSGDNAVVIGIAARRLSPERRRRAIIIGGAGAIGLRIFFTAIAAVLLDLPLIELVGGLLLLWIAWKLLQPEQNETGGVSEADTLRSAVKTIILADVVMSLDNILAVGGLADGELWLLLFGLGLSIPIILAGSEVVARVLGRVPVLVYVGVVVLIWTATRMVLEDHALQSRIREVSRVEHAVVAMVTSAVIIGLGRRAVARAVAEEAAYAAAEDAGGSRGAGA